ncbi:MAG: hypothetical protein JO270_01040, partial [Acidobacteriaceae bacterium]|nr:hypothetical protein [Acidobacteriaceae bacterium]
TALVSGFVFVGLLLAVEWPFAGFLMSPASRNRFFGTTYFWYGLPPQSHLAQNLFIPETAREFWQGIAIAVAISIMTIRWGISRGQWLGKIKR